MHTDASKPADPQSETVSDPRLLEWPRMANYPQTEAGYNEFKDAWIARRRRAVTLAYIPMWAIEENRAANALANEKGWQEIENG